ncbi:McrB family protein, partial [Acinetobacter pittii]
VKSIQKFKLSYQDLCKELALNTLQNNSIVTTQEVLSYLKARYPQSEQKTKYIFLSVNKQYKELALETKNLNTTSVRLFISDKPPSTIIEDTECRFINSQTLPNWNLEKHTNTLKKSNEYYQICPNSIEQLKSLCDWYELDQNSKSNPVRIAHFGKSNMTIDTSLNRILFGAAGTGKTFNTINHALSIIEGKSLEELKNEKREKLKERFDEYKNQGRIKFVTFHQSFSYEDFVEGIQAKTDDQGNLIYRVRPGVFKDICEKATGISQQAESIDEIVEKFLDEITETPLELKTQQNKKFKVSYMGSGVTLQCQPLASEMNATYYANISKIKSLLSGEQIENAYNRSYIKAVAEFLKPKVKPVQINKNDQNHVLIIDEINRGNISRIFGELITLIEDSKRQGAEESLSIILPYSKKPFSVPKNLYIIGTMNSSDRSLTGLDIALRRRFTFIEMPPRPELLDNLEIDGVNVQDLLTVINQRIEILLDRDHCLGHANFMILEQQPTLENLSNIFKQKVIPQLQEYFFDDWAKINLVLNGNGMLKPKPVETSAIFPNVDSEELGYFEDKKIWELVPTSFNSIESFKKIIQY